MYLLARGVTSRLDGNREVDDVPGRPDQGSLSLSDVEEGLRYLRGRLLSVPDVRSIAVCALGCGLGGLPFEPVRAAVDRLLGPIKRVAVALYEPMG